MVELEPIQDFKKPVTLPEIKADKQLENISLVKQGRLSVMTLKAEEFDRIVALGNDD